MIAAWLEKAATPLVKVGLVFVVGSGLTLVAAFVGLKAAEIFSGMIVDRVAAAIAERNAYWQGEIEKINAATERRAADQVRSAMQIQAAATDRVQAAQTELAELKVLNAHLPLRDDCGLGGDRVRLLPN